MVMNFAARSVRELGWEQVRKWVKLVDVSSWLLARQCLHRFQNYSIVTLRQLAISNRISYLATWWYSYERSWDEPWPVPDCLAICRRRQDKGRNTVGTRTPLRDQFCRDVTMSPESRVNQESILVYVHRHYVNNQTSASQMYHCR